MNGISGDLIATSNAITIRGGEPRALLLQAEADMADQKWADALKAIVAAYNTARPRIADLMYPSRRQTGATQPEQAARTPIEFAHSYSMSTAVIETTKRIEEQGSAIQNLRENIAQLEELMALLSVGISLPDYWKFKALVPDHFTPDMDWDVVRPGVALKREHVEAALNFVVTALQRWQSLDVLRDELIRAQSPGGQMQA